MEKNDIEKFRRHMGAGKSINLKNSEGHEDSFYFKPLGAKFLPDFMELALIMEYTPDQKKQIKEAKSNKLPQEEIDSLFDDFDSQANQRLMKKENFTKVINLIDEMIKISYPDLDDDLRSEFILNNFAELQGVLMDLHSDMGSKEVDEKVQKKIEQIKAQRRNA